MGDRYSVGLIRVKLGIFCRGFNTRLLRILEGKGEGGLGGQCQNKSSSYKVPGV